MLELQDKTLAIEELDFAYEEQDEVSLKWCPDLLGVSVLNTSTSHTQRDLFDPMTAQSPEAVLKHYWGYDNFRSLQGDIIHATLNNIDTLALMPTGGGKSICFQVPALMTEGLTLVVTPLISLMKDQVDRLREKGIKATAIHSGMGARAITQTIDNCIYGRYKLLYISPERLKSESFAEKLDQLSISRLVIDECHCICQWGYDFRPSYLNIHSLRQQLNNVPVLALTATATPEVVEDIKVQLGFGTTAQVFQKSFYRENISYSIRQTTNKDQMLLHILSRVAGSAIVYCRSRKRCGEIADFLRTCGVSASAFHAGLNYAERDIRQNRWMKGEVRVMVATNAFGMGIDKPNVRLVIHVTVPNSMEEYFQEAGRAGRDGQKSYAVMLVDSYDPARLKQRFRDTYPSKDYIYRTYESLCNYLSIGEGEGFKRIFELDLKHFIVTFKMHPVQTKYAIQIMQNAEWLDYETDAVPSRLKFIYSRDDLYQRHVGYDDFLRVLLRLYTGFFRDFVAIEEELIAEMTGLDAEIVYEIFKDLSRRNILHYVPRSNLPRIFFKVRREDPRQLRLPSSAYEDLKERMRERTDVALSYILGRDTCRSQYLLRYFGEEKSESCGQCDVCLRRKELGLNEYVLNDVEHYILKNLDLEENYKNGKYILDIKELCTKLSYAPTDVHNAVLFLADQLELFYLEGEFIILND